MRKIQGFATSDKDTACDTGIIVTNVVFITHCIHGYPYATCRFFPSLCCSGISKINDISTWNLVLSTLSTSTVANVRVGHTERRLCLQHVVHGVARFLYNS